MRKRERKRNRRGSLKEKVLLREPLFPSNRERWDGEMKGIKSYQNKWIQLDPSSIDSHMMFSYRKRVTFPFLSSFLLAFCLCTISSFLVSSIRQEKQQQRWARSDQMRQEKSDRNQEYRIRWKRKGRKERDEVGDDDGENASKAHRLRRKKSFVFFFLSPFLFSGTD